MEPAIGCDSLAFRFEPLAPGTLDVRASRPEAPCRPDWPRGAAAAPSKGNYVAEYAGSLLGLNVKREGVAES